jgi:hypothetical protein
MERLGQMLSTESERVTSRQRDNTLRILVLGYIVRGPLGGLAWHHLQYVLGLSQLGHDVYFVEDSDDFESCYDPSRHLVGTDPTYGLAFTSAAFARLGLGDRWCYFDAHTSQWSGPCGNRILELCRDADLLLNVSGVNPLRPWFEHIPARALIDTDPVFVQVRHLQKSNARALACLHTDFLTFGENVRSLRAVADDGFPWQSTRQPIVLSAWPLTPGRHDGRFTTVMQWDSYPNVTFGGRTFGMKSTSFDPYLDLPQRTGPIFELAIGNPPPELRLAGWRTNDALEVTRDPWTYQAYLAGSKAEFSVAKHGYVASRSGWFSERTACYLASGRPAVVQNTGFTEWLETGRGLAAFDTPEEAFAGVEDICAHYEAHCYAARQIAYAYFDSRRVLSDLLDKIFSADGPERPPQGSSHVPDV